MSLVVRKPVFGVSDTKRSVHPLKIARDSYRLETSDLNWDELYYSCSENKGANQCAVTAQLICIFAFAYAKRGSYVYHIK